MESLPSSNPAFFLVAGVSGQILPGRPGPRPVPGSEAGSARTPVPGVGVVAACTSVMADERCGSSRRNFPAVEKRCKSSLFRALENVAAGAGCRGHPAATWVQPGLRLAGLGEETRVLGEVTDTGPSSRPVGVRPTRFPSGLAVAWAVCHFASEAPSRIQPVRSSAPCGRRRPSLWSSPGSPCRARRRAQVRAFPNRWVLEAVLPFPSSTPPPAGVPGRMSAALSEPNSGF